jgi:hypothetical protein
MTETSVARLTALLDSFFSGDCQPTTFVADLRHSVYPELFKSHDVEILAARVPESSMRTVRGQIWAVFLSLGVFNAIDPETALSSLPKAKFDEIQTKLTGEIDRVRQSTDSWDRYQVSPEEFRAWLLFFSLWLNEHVEAIFDQNFYMFGIVFLRNLTLPAAVQAFVNFICRISNAYLGAQCHNKISQFLVFIPEIFDGFDPAFAAVLRQNNTVRVFSFARVASLFTQLKPIENVEKIWDFLIVYGPHLVLYIEAAFLEMRKAWIPGKAVAEPCWLDETKPLELLKRASEIYAQVNDKLDQRVKDFIYGSVETW